ncbi:F-box/RNI-like/FBD-like domains-containing protein [Arabidopsis thaliana]|uniref:F-box/RNI-like/FBD-like domains-containing protein n=1 Tax=Arabidopsis thaliana TaxID=3702 RepID=UPI000016281D|nr:F-box/RNI-like/FBD-like domains-containing protein [Arabidopsis thaliana]AED95180.1 F-box/RNI-like/FBD-like domains-containing protein [Arabidopsis thaliana]|eukprot:NP_199309.2 F-box/RNI-like/FBD-like domains-containing protein [Arabidopsis thaliana]
MEECDYINELPDSLLTQILLDLRTKDSVKTSVSSKRWRNLWLNVPGLDLFSLQFTNPHHEEGLIKFMDRFMESNCRSRLQKFMIRYFECNGYRDRFMELIGTVVDCGIQHLYVYMHTCNRVDFIRQNIYKSKTLVSLKLYNVELKNPDFVVSLPCLKILKLMKICYGEDGPLVVEKLISGCPVLEDLELIKPFDILTQDVILFLRIDAPRLKYMTFYESRFDRIMVKNMSSLFSIEIRAKSSFEYGGLLKAEDPRKRAIICDFLTVISSVRHMIISGSILEELHSYSKLGWIPQFRNLYHLQASFFGTSLQLLPTFLESCPNLKNLIMDYGAFKEENIDFHEVPQCLISTLEYVHINKLMMMEQSGIKLVNYFIENSAVLKKLTLRFSFFSSIESESYKKLLTSTKLSPTCQVIFV